MCRRARSGLAAVFIFVLAIFGSSHAASPAQAAGIHRIFVPLAATTPSLWSATELQAVALINQHRQAKGCPPAQISPELSVASKRHSRDMAENNYFSHTGLNGSTFSQRAQAASYQYWPSGEVLAAGYPTAADAVNGWMNSPAHRDIIMNCNNNDIGIGLHSQATSQWQHYWTAVFGRR
jgi:uncharacterized protein YkwD